MKTKLIIYKDSRGEFRWRMKRAGRIVAESGEGYKRIGSLRSAVTHLIGDLAGWEYKAKEIVGEAVFKARAKNFADS